MAHEAENVHGKLNGAQKALLFPILAHLIRRGELGGATRSVAQIDEFDADKRKLIQHLSSEDGGRLLLAGDSSVEIAQEALINQWNWLRTEGQKFGLDLDDLARLMDKAKAWAKQGTGDRPNYLAMGAELESFSALAARRNGWLSEEEREFALALVVMGLFGLNLYRANTSLEQSKRNLVQSTQEAKANLTTSQKNLWSAFAALAAAEQDHRPVLAAKLALAAWPRDRAMGAGCDAERHFAQPC